MSMERAGTAEHERENLADGHGEVDLFDMLLILLAARRKIVIFTIAAMALGATVAFLMKPTFAASALILPPEQGESTASMLVNQLGIGPLAGGAVKSTSDLYL